LASCSCSFSRRSRSRCTRSRRGSGCSSSQREPCPPALAIVGSGGESPPPAGAVDAILRDGLNVVLSTSPCPGWQLRPAG
jgi:hypothetical protein